MTQTYESGYETTLASSLTAVATSMVVGTAPTVTSGRLYLKSGTNEEWIDFSGVSGTTLTGLTRGLSQTADPSTAGTGKAWIAGTPVVLVAMHDQLVDKYEGQQILQEAKTYATTAARDSALGADGAATKAYTGIYVTATGLHYNYNLSSNQWEDVDTGTTTPNGSETESGSFEEGTDAEVTAGTATGGTGAKLAVTPTKLGKVIQSGSYVYAVDAEASDTYVIAMTPTLTAYTAGQRIMFKANTANTGAATLNVDGLGAKNIVDRFGQPLLNNEILAGEIVDVVYDGTNFIFKETDLADSIYGDGSDGDVTASTGSLTADMFYANLTIPNGVTLTTDGYKIFVRGKLTIAAGGTIANNGENGSNGSGATGGAGGAVAGQGSLNAEIAGVAGGNGGTGAGTAGTAGTASATSYTNIDGVQGGAGGTGSGGAGGAAGALGASTRGTAYNTVYSARNVLAKLFHLASAGDMLITTQYTSIASSSGGGGGGGDGGTAGGGGGGSGGNGGLVWIAAKEFDNKGTIEATGGTGGNGAAAPVGGGDRGGGGGGGGGNGGIFILLRSTLTDIGTVTLTGGTGGSGGAKTGAGVATDGSAGTTGATGETVQITIT